MTQTLRRSILAADLAWGVLAMALAYVFRYGWLWNSLRDPSSLVFLQPLLAALLFWSLLSHVLDLDGFHGGWHSPAVMSHLFLGVTALMGILFSVGSLSPFFVSGLALAYFGVLLFLGLLAIRFAARVILRSRYRSGSVRRVVIVGAGALAREVAVKISRHPEMLCRVVGFLYPAETGLDAQLPDAGCENVSVKALGVAPLLNKEGVDEIILALPKSGHPSVLDLAARCRIEGITVTLIPHPYELYLSKPRLLDLDGLPLLQMRETTLASANPAWKRILDLLICVCLLPFSILVLLPAAAVLKWNKGTAFCRELRCGQHGKQFWMSRLNSNRQAKDLPRYERFLQDLSVTELPQIWNVLRGEMSLVGPRPEPLERVKLYSDWHSQRLNGKPGMTGLAQVHGLREQHPSEDKTRFDLQYMLNPSPFLDISLLMQGIDRPSAPIKTRRHLIHLVYKNS